MIRLTIEELQERWMMLYYEMGIDKLLITENLKLGKRSFVVSGLKMEYVEDLVLCSDDNDVIIDNVCRLMMFLRHQITSIILIPTDTGTGYIERLEFGDMGTVLIEKAS